jgi:hypothetical protein
MKLAFLALAALGLLVAIPSASACPPQGHDYYLPDCVDSPILLGLGRCVGFAIMVAHDTQVYAGETVSCL